MAQQPGVGHVHGLATNPEDGILFAATHAGMLRLGPNGSERVAGPSQDTMGFEVVGRNRFLASGHPGPDEGPDALGLIRSDDSALSWRPVALSGQADFHALSASGVTVYGFDAMSLTVMRSDDAGLTWLRVAAIGPVGSLAADPDDARQVLATTPAGLLHSVDGGLTFAPAVVQPPRLLVLIDHAPRIGGGGEAAIAGMDQTGTAWTLSQGTWTWTMGNALGVTPQAFSVLGPDRYVVATDDGIRSTEDAGRTWTLIATTG